tara:strand:+ start:268 stop:948 length:681 start_codon:yes stop_codon:yes gene_type:complete
MIEKKLNLFIACDTKKISSARKVIKYTETKKLNIGYKFGLQFLNTKNGRFFISRIKKKIIFLDLKLNDIPNTCASAINAVKDLKVNYLTIHISSGLEALKMSKKVSGKMKLVGVTTLTSLNDNSLKEIGYKRSIKNLVQHQAKLANKAKLDAIVCSPHELKLVRKIFKGEIITPGIRLNSKLNDQKRVMSPKKAVTMGSDWLVIGRSITNGNIKRNMKNLIDHLLK